MTSATLIYSPHLNEIPPKKGDNSVPPILLLQDPEGQHRGKTTGLQEQLTAKQATHERNASFSRTTDCHKASD